MEFANHTPFPALAFAGIDQNSQDFHVVVLRQTLTWDDQGTLIFADEQAPLCDADTYFGGGLDGAVRQESDLCQYKPRCDVVVNATAYPPRPVQGTAPRRFDVRVVLKRPDTEAPPPAKPQGLNPLMHAAPEELQQWRKTVAQTASRRISGQRLIDKTLTVTGERAFVKHLAPIRFFAAALRLSTLGLARVSPWRVTTPKPATPTPVRLDRAFGGERLISADSPAAARVPKKHRINAVQVANRPTAASGAPSPVAYDAFAANPVGLGFAPNWYLKATRSRRLTAPQVESPNHPVGAVAFDRARAGKVDVTLVAGLGVRPKSHPERVALVGTIDQTFIDSGAPLPEDFDFAVWNAAWPDQQIESLCGDETIELTNLCAPDTPALKQDAQGNGVLRLALPPFQPYVLVRFDSGVLAPMALTLDTLIIEPDDRTVSLVFRTTLPATPIIRKIEARQMPRRQWDAALNGQDIDSSSRSTIDG